MEKDSAFPVSSNGAAAAVAKQNTCAEGDSREARIAELRRRYLEGNYRVTAEQLSSKLIEKHLER
jgi:anti-sigma28 factor (negative regulator of flagellin synthesis)